MPWVIKEYKAKEINLEDASIYRDLSTPIGAIYAHRLDDYRKRYYETPEGADKFLFGSHYSCPGYVIGFHIRDQP
jgi:factor associated with neutral sphingomyelinase activation